MNHFSHNKELTYLKRKSATSPSGTNQPFDKGMLVVGRYVQVPLEYLSTWQS